MSNALRFACTLALLACDPSTPPSPGGEIVEQIASGGACPAATGPGTTHAFEVTADETWTAADSPHHIGAGGLRLLNGAHLTIEPCAEVRIAANAILQVGDIDNPASLTARGTRDGDAIQPVRFVPEEAGTHWGAIEVTYPGSIDLAYVALEDAASIAGLTDYIGAIGILGDDTGTVQPIARVENVLVRGAEGYGITLHRYGAFTADSHDLTVDRSGSDAYPFPVQIGSPAIGSLPTGRYTGNRVDEIGIDPLREITDMDAIRDRGVPYRLDTALYVRGTGSTGQATLTIDAGVTIRMVKNDASSIRIGDAGGSPGALVALGTAAAPITFTSADAAPGPADWLGIYFDNSLDGPSNLLDHVIVEYAGGDSRTNGASCGPSDNDSSILITNFRPDQPLLQNSEIRHGGGYAGLVLGWESDADGPDYLSTNAFTDVPLCRVARWRNASPPTCPGNDDVDDCL